MKMKKFCSEVRIEGLETLDYFDNLVNRSRFTEQADAITFDGEVGIIKHHFSLKIKYYSAHCNRSSESFDYTASFLYKSFVVLVPS